MVTLCDKCGETGKKGNMIRFAEHDYCSECMWKLKDVIENWNHEMEEEN